MIHGKAMTAMYTLPVSGADAPQMPRFDDGMVDMRELLRAMAESLVNENMDAQAEDACADGNQRNGYRERRLITSVGAINLLIPKLRRGSCFPEDLLTRYSRVDRAVIAAVAEMGANGVSTRKVEGGGGVSRHRPHERLPGVEDMRVAGRYRGRPAKTGPLRRLLPLHLGRRHLRQVPRRRPRVVVREYCAA